MTLYFSMAQTRSVSTTAGATPAVPQTTAADRRRRSAIQPIVVPKDVGDATLTVAGRSVRLTNLRKIFWPGLGLTKVDLLQYYADVAPVLLPHLVDRAMVMKRYPDGAAGPFFFMKRTPEPRPEWIQTCSIEHASGNVIAFPLVQDLPSLLWLVNLGCIDLNPWYARCDDVDRPDYLHFDLDPVPAATFDNVRAGGAHTEDFRIDNVPSRIAKVGDLWAPLNARRGRVDLTRFIGAARH